MILFASKEGTGKSMFYSLLKSMIGTRFYSIGDVKKNLIGNFNSSLLYAAQISPIYIASHKNSSKPLLQLLVPLQILSSGIHSNSVPGGCIPPPEQSKYPPPYSILQLVHVL